MATTTTETRLPPGGEAATEHKPYVPDEITIPEFTWPGVLVGAILGVVFGAS